MTERLTPAEYKVVLAFVRFMNEREERAIRRGQPITAAHYQALQNELALLDVQQQQQKSDDDDFMSECDEIA